MMIMEQGGWDTRYKSEEIQDAWDKGSKMHAKAMVEDGGICRYNEGNGEGNDIMEMVVMDDAWGSRVMVDDKLKIRVEMMVEA